MALENFKDIENALNEVEKKPLKIVFLDFIGPFETSNILKFKTRGKKAENDSDNKLRESILEQILDLNLDDIPDDDEYKKDWIDLKTKWKDILISIIPEKFRNKVQEINIKQKGGRTHNYDFLVEYDVEECKKILRKVEFKFNCKELKDLPQFIQLPDSSDIIRVKNKGVLYSEFYFDKYLEDYLKLDNRDIIEKSEYLKHIKKVDRSCHPFFEKLYKNYENNKKAKEDIINKSIKDFIEKYNENLNIDYLFDKINEPQKDKYYIMFSYNPGPGAGNKDGGIFYVDKIPLLDKDNHMITYTKNTIVIDNVKSKGRYKLLLRWKNRLGVLNPAWQISYSP